MVRWFLIVLACLFVAGILGFAGVATVFAFAGIAVIVAVVAKVLFWVFLAVAAAFLIGYAVRWSREAR
ncbi:MAG: DUF1328 domain-containing protein [Bauldia litoralis]